MYMLNHIHNVHKGSLYCLLYTSYGSQSVESQAEMVRKVKAYKAGFVPSDSNIAPDQTLKAVSYTHL